MVFFLYRTAVLLGNLPNHDHLMFLLAFAWQIYTVKSQFFEYSIIQNSRFFEPKVISLGFASVKHCNFTPDFSNAQFFKTPDTSNYFFLPLKNLHSIFRTLKTQEPTKTGFSHVHTWMQLTSCGRGVFMHFLLQSKWQICHWSHKNCNTIVTQLRVLKYCTWSKFLHLFAFFKLFP